MALSLRVIFRCTVALHPISLRTISLCLPLCLMGCGEYLQPAQGSITVDGKPLSIENGSVMFVPVEPGRPATGQTDEHGKFVLSYKETGDGLPPGDYKVVIVGDVWKPKPRKGPNRDAEILKAAGVDDPESIFEDGVLIHVVPQIYNDIATTPLTLKVEKSSQPQNFEINIESKKPAAK
jgi:hypothetical protein